MAQIGSQTFDHAEQASHSAERRARNWPPRHLSRRVSALIWGLRVYVVMMVGVVAVQLVHLM